MDLGVRVLYYVVVKRDYIGVKEGVYSFFLGEWKRKWQLLVRVSVSGFRGRALGCRWMGTMYGDQIRALLSTTN